MAIPVERDAGHIVKVASTTLGVSLLILAALTTRNLPRPRAVATARPGEHTVASTDCVVDGPATYIALGRVWCSSAVAAVRINTDTRNFGAEVTLRERGLSIDAIAEFRRLTDDVASASPMNVRVVIRDSTGAVLGTCSRDLIHTAAVCAAGK